MDSTNICVVGCGHWGKNLVRVFSSLETLYAVCDTDLERATTVASIDAGARVFTDFRSVLADPAVTGVAIATPAELHYELATAALEAGKHVFVEKPLALEWQDGAAMVETARQYGRILMVGHLLHYHPAVVRLKKLVSDGLLGRIEYIYSNRLSMGKIRREENALWSFAPHDISLILSLVGQTPFQVTATGGSISAAEHRRCDRVQSPVRPRHPCSHFC